MCDPTDDDGIRSIGVTRRFVRHPGQTCVLFSTYFSDDSRLLCLPGVELGSVGSSIKCVRTDVDVLSKGFDWYELERFDFFFFRRFFFSRPIPFQRVEPRGSQQVLVLRWTLEVHQRTALWLLQCMFPIIIVSGAMFTKDYHSQCEGWLHLLGFPCNQFNI